MALYYDLPVYRDAYKLILKIFEFAKKFSKEYLMGFYIETNYTNETLTVSLLLYWRTE